MITQAHKKNRTYNCGRARAKVSSTRQRQPTTKTQKTTRKAWMAWVSWGWREMRERRAREPETLRQLPCLPLSARPISAAASTIAEGGGARPMQAEMQRGGGGHKQQRLSSLHPPAHRDQVRPPPSRPTAQRRTLPGSVQHLRIGLRCLISSEPAAQHALAASGRSSAARSAIFSRTWRHVGAGLPLSHFCSAVAIGILCGSRFPLHAGDGEGIIGRARQGSSKFVVSSIDQLHGDVSS
jgi:hypothetical protein